MSNTKYSLTDALISAERRCFTAGSIYGMHWHDYIEMEIVLSGRVEHIHNSEVCEIGMGSAYIVTHHDLHAFRAMTDVELVNISFDISLLEDSLSNSLMYSAEKKLSCLFDSHRAEQIYMLCGKLIEEHASKATYSEIMCKNIVSMLVIEVIRASRPHEHEATAVQKALDCIHRNFKQEISLMMLADKLNLTPNYLGRIFSESVGVTFNSYLNQIRLRYVCNMLLFSSLTVKEIALMSGYSSVEYFFAVFKKHFGISPAEYRRTNTQRLAFELVSTSSVII